MVRENIINVSETIGIILVNYNGYQLTTECMKSLEVLKENSLKKNLKIYIVDNNSSDGSYEKLRKFILNCMYDNVTIVKSKDNLGFAGGNNIAIKRALKDGADYVLLLNNDTLVDKDFLGYLLEPFKLYKDCYASVSKIYYESDKNKIWYAGGEFSYKTGKTKHLRYDEQDDNRPGIIRKVTFATGCCLCISRECIQNVGMLCEDYFLYDEDTDYCLRILESGHSIYYAPQSIVYHKVNASTGKKKGMIDYYVSRNRLWLIRKHIKKGKLIAGIVSIWTYLYWCIKGKMSFRYYLKGTFDGIIKKN